MRRTYKPGLSLLSLALLLLLALPPAAPAAAQDAAPPAAQADRTREQLMLFAANNASFDQEVEDYARTLFRRQIGGCDTFEQVVRQLPTAYGRLAFPSAPQGHYPAPRHGLWGEHVKIRGCGKVRQVNMLMVARARNEKPLILAMIPGDTLSDPASQRTAERMGAAGIKKADATCSADARATYTKRLGFRQPDGKVGPADAGEGWFEEWTYRFCQKDMPVQMAFIPDGSGGYQIKARVVGTNPPAAPAAKPDPAAPAAQ